MDTNGNQPSHGFGFGGSGDGPNHPNQNGGPSGPPLGMKHKPKVVEHGQEHTGRWTREEHEAFLLALQQYGKEWKKVAAKVKTRTVVQTRTHAQKYFQKLQKGLANDKGDVTMGTVAEAKKILPIASARRGSGPSSAKKGRKKQEKKNGNPMSAQKRQAAEATEAAAHLITQISQVSTANEDQSMLNTSIQPATSFPTGTTNFSTGTSVAGGLPSMKIVAPQPEQTIKKNKFPEPSPAACGKRKIAEIAAAQMLAGAMGTSIPVTGNMARASTPTPEDAKISVKSIGSAGAGMSLQIINPDNLQSEELPNKKIAGNEPVTPWDGQLELLNSEVKSKVVEEKVEEVPNGEASAPLPAVIGPRGLERSALHAAVCSGSIGEVERQIKLILDDKEGEVVGEKNLKIALQALDPLGFSPLHAAVTLSHDHGEASLNITRMLLGYGIIITSLDSYGNTALHWAARMGNTKIMEMLVIDNCPLDAQNESGEIALHWAMRAGHRGLMAAQFLLENGSRSSISSKSFQRPIDVAGEGFKGLCSDNFPIENGDPGFDLDTISSQQLTDIRRQSRAKLFSFSPSARTLILHHPECLEHIPKNDTDWEAPDRVNAILNHLLDTSTGHVRDHEIQVTTEFDKASLEFLSRVHSAEYLTFVNNLSKELEKRLQDEKATSSKVPSVVPFTPMVQRTVMREPDVKQGSHSDTSFSSGSLRAARRAAGAVKHAVDCVLVGRNRNAFCITRPPGHHAGINGLLDGGESCGFCIFNNVAAGALHALSDENHRPKCERCAIVDIDVHHGNGTEEIVKRCDHPGRLFFFSVHLYDNDRAKKSNGFKFYPGTGDEDDVAHNVINVPIAPMWKNSQPRSRSQSPIPERSHNTRNKNRQKALQTGEGSETASIDAIIKERTISSSSAEEQIGGTKDSTFQPQSPNRSTPKKQSQPSFLYGTGREAYRKSIQQRLLPALRAFNPDLILLSIGLDACKGDVGNARHYRNGRQVQGIDLTPEDYAWTTQKIMEVADICCHGRLVSVLEGGYGQPSESNPDSLLDKSMISECARAHLQALIDPADVEKRREA